ncbi:MAG: hypothetical protein C0503_06580 [Gemmatimonas sp.]|nr:hypothetical protein [Gemmatimonas sp.]
MRYVKLLSAAFGVLLMLGLLVRPACACGGSQAYFSATKADLRNLHAAQERFFADSARYARSLEELTARGLEVMSSVSLTLTPVSDSVWQAVGTHERLPQVRCEISNANDVSSVSPEAGNPWCEPNRLKRRWVLNFL